MVYALLGPSGSMKTSKLMNIQTDSVGHKTKHMGINVGKISTERVGGDKNERRFARREM